MLVSLTACAKAPTSGDIEPVATADLSAETETLRVVTFNTWMVPLRTDGDGLAERIATAIDGLDAHLVVLQEVWAEEDARALSAALRRRGFDWVCWRASDAAWFYGSPGLMLASVYPLSKIAFTPYRAGTLPIMVWQPDFFSGKGYLSADVETPAGQVRIVTTHAQADYTTNRYASIRLSQMLQLGRDLSTVPSPLILAGDINVRRGESGYDGLVRSARLDELASDYGVDAILTRGAATLDLREVSSRRVLERDAHGRLSDHHGVLAAFALERRTAGDSEPSSSTSTQSIWNALDDERLRLWGQAALALPVLLGSITSCRRLVRTTMSRLWQRLVSHAAVFVLSCIALWSLYFLAVYLPAQAGWLADAAADLHAATTPARRR